MKGGARVTVAVAALLLGLIFFFPLWRIALKAPQYPEGLGLRIWVNRITGAAPQDLNSINNLNHYIGMKRIEPDDIPELRFMPAIVATLIGTGLAVAVLARRRVLIGWVGLLGLVALAGLADFWKWGYDYGHQLAPDAIISIPGMTYQPPLIGHKQLLNFSASSWPGVGGWAIIAALVLGFLALYRTPRSPAGAGKAA